MFNFFRSKEKALEEARLNLETDLKNGRMSFLIEKMASIEIYSPLLKKKRENEISSTDDVSWYAYERARDLKDNAFKKELLVLLDTLDFSYKRHTYYALAHLCANTIDHELFSFLMDKLESEKDQDSQLAILLGIKKMPKPRSLNIEPLKRLAKVRKNEIRIAAIHALEKTDDPEVEPLLIEIFINAKNSHLKNMVCTPLETVGTELCIPILEAAYKKTRDALLRHCIEISITEIKKRALAARAK